MKIFITPEDVVTLVTVDERKTFKIINDKRGYYKCNGVPLELAIEQYKSNPANNYVIDSPLEQRHPNTKFVGFNDFGKVPRKKKETPIESKDDLSIPPNTPY
jgi:hypothetical protein